MKRLALAVAVLLAIAAHASAVPVQTDVKGCTDHPLLTRMPDSWIHNCDHKVFDAHVFATGPGKTVSVEGEVWSYSYYPQASATNRPSEVQIRRNYENAVKAIGGTVVGQDRGHETFRLLKDGNEIWVDLTAEFTGKYGFTIVQKKAMQQDVTADAAAFANGLRATGHVAVYGILFDTGKATLKPESKAALAEVAKLLTSDPALRLLVVGHTDNVGAFDANMELSRARANAVVQELVTSHGVAAARLRACGDGSTAPVASNADEAGRAKNRRVELVQQ